MAWAPGEGGGGGGGAPEMGSRAGPFVLCKDGCCHQRRRNTNFGPEKIFSRKNFPPHLSSQNDQRDVGIILSHVCWGRPPPPPSTATKEGEGGGWANGIPCHPPPPRKAIFFPPWPGYWAFRSFGFAPGASRAVVPNGGLDSGPLAAGAGRWDHWTTATPRKSPGRHCIRSLSGRPGSSRPGGVPFCGSLRSRAGSATMRRTVRHQKCIGRKGASEAAPEAVGQAVGGGFQSGWGRLLSVTNAVEAGTWRQGDSGWA